ncbi:MAG: S8 family serine peptidase [Acidobacteriota bacterium]
MQSRISSRRALCAAVLFLFALIPALAETVPGRYIVELSTEPTPAFLSTQRARLRTEQRGMRTRLEARNARVVESVETVANALIVDIADADAAKLATIPGVKRVLPVRKLKLLMDRAVVLHHIPEAWARLEDGRAGAGVKIAIIDTGIEAGHPALQNPTLVAPDSYPRANNDAGLAFTTNKVIVARSYVSLLPSRDSDTSPRDRIGHGTALAMITAGVRAAAPLATMSGIAPAAWLGNYKVFGSPGQNDGTTDDAVLKAIDDAVADGMDIINLSLGNDLAERLEYDPLVAAVERATRAGVIVIAAAGNNGGDLNTLSSPATAPSAIAVGASTNDRTFAASATVEGLGDFVAVVGSGTTAATPITAPLVSAAASDGNGLACGQFPPASLANRVVLIMRGTCTFETKILNAQRAGALAALVYAAADAPDPFVMGMGSATLPAEMIGNRQGAYVKENLDGGRECIVTLRFALGAVPVQGNDPASFSAAGPSVDLGLKPDLVAAGQNIYTATQTVDSRGAMYSADGYVLVDGTSFSAPITAGAAALIKGARPGLTIDQYRSLLINTATSTDTTDGYHRDTQLTGAGLLNVDAALQSTVAAMPSSVSFGASGINPNLQRALTLTNLGTAEETYFLSTAPHNPDLPAPMLDETTVTLAPGASRQLAVSFQGTNLTPGPYQGFLNVAAASTGATIRVPYWYAATANEPARIVILDRTASGRANAVLRNAIYFRVIDSSGVAITAVPPEVSVVTGDGVIRQLNKYDSDVPGLYSIHVVLGAAPGVNTFRIQAGAATRDVTITGN